jgi:hypothetical protein
MATFIKAGFWEKLCQKCTGYKGWLNLDQFVNSRIPAPTYKVYTALLNQSGINPPTAEVLENTFGGEATFQYIEPGIYGITFPIVFPREKAWISLTNNKYGENAILQYEINGTPISGFVIHTSKFTLGSPANISLANDCLEYASLEIRVYN